MVVESAHGVPAEPNQAYSAVPEILKPAGKKIQFKQPAEWVLELQAGIIDYFVGAGLTSRDLNQFPALTTPHPELTDFLRDQNIITEGDAAYIAGEREEYPRGNKWGGYQVGIYPRDTQKKGDFIRLDAWFIWNAEGHCLGQDRTFIEMNGKQHYFTD